jgi:hypothetical protein
LIRLAPTTNERKLFQRCFAFGRRHIQLSKEAALLLEEFADSHALENRMAQLNWQS